MQNLLSLVQRHEKDELRLNTPSPARPLLQLCHALDLLWLKVRRAGARSRQAQHQEGDLRQEQGREQGREQSEEQGQEQEQVWGREWGQGQERGVHPETICGDVLVGVSGGVGYGVGWA